MAPRRRMGRSSATAAPCGRVPEHDLQPPTRQLDRTRRSGRCRLRLASGWPGIPPKHFELAAGPAAVLAFHMAIHPGSALSPGTKPAKSRTAFLRSLSSLKLACFVACGDPVAWGFRETQPNRREHRALNRPASSKSGGWPSRRSFHVH